MKTGTPAFIMAVGSFIAAGTIIFLVANTKSLRVATYQVGTSEWGYTLTSDKDFVHAERGFSAELDAENAARAYIKLNKITGMEAA